MFNSIFASHEYHRNCKIMLENCLEKTQKFRIFVLFFLILLNPLTPLSEYL